MANWWRVGWKRRKAGRRRSGAFFIFLVYSRPFPAEFRDPAPLRPAFIAATPKGAFIFISIMGHRDVYGRGMLGLCPFALSSLLIPRGPLVSLKFAMFPCDPSRPRREPTGIKIPRAVSRFCALLFVILWSTRDWSMSR